MRKIHEIDYKGLRLEVSGCYYRGSSATWEQPGDPEEFEIHEVYLNGTDISSLFNDFHELEYITLEEHYI